MEKREIKFRAWTSAGMQYNVGVHSFQNMNLKFVLPEDPHDYKDGEQFIYSPGMVELMQYTGLKDKNGKEIYEGDVIVQDRYPFFEAGKSNYVGVVEWVFSQWQYILRVVAKGKRGISDGINCSMNDTGFEEGEKTDFEVIGNIYENPSLLK